MEESVVSTTGVHMDKSMFCFQTVTLRNRLDMDIEVDLRILSLGNEKVIIVSNSEGYHRKTVEKNIEQIAFQLKRMHSPDSTHFSLIEYTDVHYKKKTETDSSLENIEEWWQWRFNWVGNTPLDGQRYLLSSSKIADVKEAMLDQQAVLSRDLGSDCAPRMSASD